jgi:hypothetical protein
MPPECVGSVAPGVVTTVSVVAGCFPNWTAAFIGGWDPNWISCGFMIGSRYGVVG